MAIDDNTIYGLYGSQIKDLPEKINAVKGKAKVLTSADYVYPTGNPQGWRVRDLASGVYMFPSGSKLYRYNENYYHLFGDSVLGIVNSSSSRGTALLLESINDKKFVVIADSSSFSQTLDSGGLTENNIIDNLTTTSYTEALSAKQGKVLKDFIGDLTNLTTTDKTNLVAAINEAAAGGGGGITELTSADYDYPTDNPNRVLLGNLPAGIYYRSNSVDVGVRTELLSSNQNFFIIMRSSGSTRVYANILGQSGSANGGIYQDLQVWAINGTSGSLLEKSGALSTENLTQATGTSTTNVMSQNATTNAINAISQSGSGAPTTATVGTVGQLYQDTTNGKLYICTDTTGGTYTWEEVGAGGSGPTVVQTTGNSTTDVMSQNATSRMVFADPSSKTQVQIGSGANAGANTGNATVAIGNGAKAYQYGGDGSSSIYQTAVGPEAVAKGNRSLALGANSSATYTGSVAVGAGANATSVGQFDIGSQYTAYGYNSSNYRLLTGVHAPQDAHDAANKEYVDTAVGAKQDVLTAGDNITIAEESGALVISSTGGGANAFTTNEWNALWA